MRQYAAMPRYDRHGLRKLRPPTLIEESLLAFESGSVGPERWTKEFRTAVVVHMKRLRSGRAPTQ
eukprot:996964-Amphidinium_carterae.1